MWRGKYNASSKGGYLIIAVGFLLLVSGVRINPYFHSSTSITAPEYYNLTHPDNGFFVTVIPSNMTKQSADIGLILNFSTGAPGNVSILIPVKDLSNLSYYTLGKFGIKPSSNDSSVINFNNVSPGSYALVEYHSAPQLITIDPAIQLYVGGILADSGAVLIFAGFVIIIISVVDRRRSLRNEVKGIQ